MARGDESFARAPSQSSIRLVTVLGIKGDGLSSMPLATRDLDCIRQRSAYGDRVSYVNIEPLRDIREMALLRV